MNNDHDDDDHLGNLFDAVDENAKGKKHIELIDDLSIVELNTLEEARELADTNGWKYEQTGNCMFFSKDDFTRDHVSLFGDSFDILFRDDMTGKWGVRLSWKGHPEKYRFDIDENDLVISDAMKRLLVEREIPHVETEMDGMKTFVIEHVTVKEYKALETSIPRILHQSSMKDGEYNDFTVTLRIPREIEYGKKIEQAKTVVELRGILDEAGITYVEKSVTRNYITVKPWNPQDFREKLKWGCFYTRETDKYVFVQQASRYVPTSVSWKEPVKMFGELLSRMLPGVPVKKKETKNEYIIAFEGLTDAELQHLYYHERGKDVLVKNTEIGKNDNDCEVIIGKNAFSRMENDIIKGIWFEGTSVFSGVVRDLNYNSIIHVKENGIRIYNRDRLETIKKFVESVPEIYIRNDSEFYHDGPFLDIFTVDTDFTVLAAERKLTIPELRDLLVAHGRSFDHDTSCEYGDKEIAWIRSNVERQHESLELVFLQNEDAPLHDIKIIEMWPGARDTPTYRFYDAIMQPGVWEIVDKLGAIEMNEIGNMNVGVVPTSLPVFMDVIKPFMDGVQLVTEMKKIWFRARDATKPLNQYCDVVKFPGDHDTK